MHDDSSQAIQLVESAAAGDERARNALFARYQDKLRRMVSLRLDRRAQARLGASDVVQEAYLEATRRLDEYLRNPSSPFFLWLRSITGYKLLELMRRELGTEQRDPRRETPIIGGEFPSANSGVMADQLIASVTGPSTVVVRAELKDRVQAAIDELEPLDREVLALRHFEQLDNVETAQVLGIQPSAARKRHFRALRRLKDVLSCLVREVQGA